MSLIHVENVVLVLMGPGEAKRKELQSLAEQDGTIGQRVFFHDPVPQDKLIAYTQSADAGIIPYPHIDLNSYYCTPNKLFDFLVANLPILANQSPELKRYVADLGVGMVHAMPDAQGIAEAIDAFWAEDHQGYKARLRDGGTDYIWDHQGQHVVNLYEALSERIEQPAWPMES
jgi:glycosyltransferase involved in cell wall biosynthesis